MRLRIRTNVSTILLFFTALSLEDFASLMPSTQYIIPGLFRFSDIGTILGSLFFLWSYFGVESKQKVKYAYGKNIIAFLIIIVISSFMAYVFFKQSIFLGLRSERKIIICFLLYFSIIRLLKTGIISYKNFVQTLFLVGGFELIVYILQFILADTVTFVYANASERYDSLRLGVPYLLPLLLGFVCISDVMTNKVKRVRKITFNLIFFGGAVFLLVGICKHRAPTLCLCCTLVFAYLIWKKGLNKKIIIGVLFFFMALVIFQNTDLFYNIINTSIQDIMSRSREVNNFSIRQMGQLYYLEKLIKSPFFGYGPPNINNDAAYYAAGVRYRYYLVDNGVLGFAYMYGLVGLCWLVLLFKKIHKMSLYLYKKKISYMPILYFCFETLNLYIGMHWFYAYHFPFVAALVMLEYEYYIAKSTYMIMRNKS